MFFAQIGPTGGDNGYSAITKHVGWGISWYINGLLIPEIYVVRGKTYTFVVEGGDDKVGNGEVVEVVIPSHRVAEVCRWLPPILHHRRPRGRV